ncbi:MAG: hypothetical protein KR126chlam2_00378 [Chlamydiae bacterium]|nr:hypothetical protein [Chlamydiota bacterium]
MEHYISLIKKTLCFFLFFYAGFIQAEEILPEWQKSLQSLSSEERLYLEAFFRTMFTNSEGGFVLAGSKPVCMEGILSPDTFSTGQIGTKIHRRSVDLCEGYRTWRKYFASIPSKKLIICCKNHPDKQYSDWIHLLWINPQKLIEVVQENLPLFQYVLGPQVTPTSFLLFLTDPSQDIPHDYTLTGIFLGFGSQNALYYQRLELIQKQIFSRENPPFNPINERLNIPSVGYLGCDNAESFNTEPSFSYSTLRDEYQSLEEMGASSIETSPSSLFKIPLFAVYKKDKETLAILSRYQTDQKMVENLLLKPNFLEESLKCIFE